MNSVPLTASQKKAVFERDNYTCQQCGHVGEYGDRPDCVQVHHIKPRRDGGTNDIDNLMTLCTICHTKTDSVGRPAKYDSGTMIPTCLSLTAEQRGTAARIGGTKAAGAQKALDAVRLLSDEQWAWLLRRDDAPAALEDAVRQAMAVERAEAEADATVDGYSSGRW